MDVNWEVAINRCASLAVRSQRFFNGTQVLHCCIFILKGDTGEIIRWINMARVASPFLGSDCQSPPSKSSSWDRNKIIGQLQVEGFEILELWEEKSEGKRCIERIYSNSGCTLTMDACSHYVRYKLYLFKSNGY